MGRLFVAVLTLLLFTSTARSQNDAGEQLLRGVLGIIGNEVVKGLDRDNYERSVRASLSWADIQIHLNQKGFDAGVVDNRPGPQTVAAIRRFQSSLRQPSTGTLTDQQATILVDRPYNSRQSAEPAEPARADRQQEIRNSNLQYVKRFLNEESNKYKPKYFYLDVPDHFRSNAIVYVKNIGGAIVSRGTAHYTLKYDEVYYSDSRKIKLEAMILSRDLNTNQEYIALYSSIEARCSTSRNRAVGENCASAALRLRREVLYGFI